MGSFADQIDNPDRGLVVDDRGSRVALVAFGGLHGKLAMPPFEFFGLARDWDVTKIFVRDLKQCWYQGGVPELGLDFRSMVTGLHALLDSLGCRPVLFGTSAGGYAALAAAALGDRGEAHVFGPQTTIRRVHRQAMSDDRWPRNIRAARVNAGPGAVMDLQPLVAAGTRARLHVHAASDSPLDVAHAQRLAGLPGVEVHEHESGGHTFVRQLKQSGRLGEIINQALAKQDDGLGDAR